MTANIFPFTLPIRLDWSEMDLFGHINNVSYFKYIQASRVNCWEQIGIQQLFAEQNKGAILASVKMDFIQPLHFPGNCEIQARIEFIGNSSFGIHHKIYNEQKEICAEAHDVMVMYDFNTLEKIPFPAVLQQKVEVLQGQLEK